MYMYFDKLFDIINAIVKYVFIVSVNQNNKRCTYDIIK